MQEIRATNGLILLSRCRFLLYIIGFLIYFLSPLDLIPELSFGLFGMVDDMLVLGYVVVAITGFFYNILVERNNQQIRAR